MEPERAPHAPPGTVEWCGIVIVVAWYVAVRYVHVHDALPYLWQGDEPRIYLEVFRMMLGGTILPQHFSYGPYFYLVVLAAAVAGFGSASAAGAIPALNAVSVRMFDVNDGWWTTLPQAIAAGRTVGVAVSALTALGTYLIARRWLRSRYAGFLAVVLLAFNARDVRLAGGIVRPDVYAQAIAVWAVVVLLWNSEAPTRWGVAALGGLLAGLSIGFKFNATIPLTVLAAGQAWQLVRSRGATGRAFLGFGAGLLAGVAPLVALVAARFDFFLWNYNYELAHYYFRGDACCPWPGSAWKQAVSIGRWLLMRSWSPRALSVLVTACGVAAVALAAAGLARAARRRPRGRPEALPGDRRGVTLAVSAAIVGLGIATNAQMKAFMPQNMAPVVPFVALLAAHGVDQLFRIVSQRSNGRIPATFLRAGLVVAVVLLALGTRPLAWVNPARFDSRCAAIDFLQQRGANLRVAVSPRLRFAPQELARLKWATALDGPMVEGRWPEGVDILVLPADEREAAERSLAPLQPRTLVSLGTRAVPAGEGFVLDPSLAVIQVNAEILGAASDAPQASFWLASQHAVALPRERDGDLLVQMSARGNLIEGAYPRIGMAIDSPGAVCPGLPSLAIDDPWSRLYTVRVPWSGACRDRGQSLILTHQDFDGSRYYNFDRGVTVEGVRFVSLRAFQKMAFAAVTSDYGDNAPGFQPDVVESRSYATLAMNGQADWAVDLADARRILVRVVASGTRGGGRYPTATVVLLDSRGRVVSSTAIQLEGRAIDYYVFSRTVLSGRVTCRVVFRDDFFEAGKEDRNALIHRVEWRAW